MYASASINDLIYATYDLSLALRVVITLGLRAAIPLLVSGRMQGLNALSLHMRVMFTHPSVDGILPLKAMDGIKLGTAFHWAVAEARNVTTNQHTQRSVLGK
jgi:hypothetical protein